MNTTMIFNFSKDANIESWNIEDDQVMGGVSQGKFEITPEGHGLFHGEVSLENNGGFSSVQHRFSPISVKSDDKIRIKLKGDGKRYQFRVKHQLSDYASYITYFETSGEWQDIELRLGDLYPTYRGRELDRPNFDHDTIEEVRFLIGNKKPQSFRLLIDKIELIKE